PDETELRGCQAEVRHGLGCDKTQNRFVCERNDLEDHQQTDDDPGAGRGTVAILRGALCFCRLHLACRLCCYCHHLSAPRKTPVCSIGCESTVTVIVLTQIVGKPLLTKHFYWNWACRMVRSFLL